jgi:TolB-like protein
VQLIDSERGVHLWADQFDTDRALISQNLTGESSRFSTSSS